MLNRLPAIWDSIRISLWIVPTLMFFSGVALATGLLAFEFRMAVEEQMEFARLYSGGAVDARSLLSTLLTSMITMASIVFSVTVVALTLAANQYGSRLSRVIRADLRTQLTLGTFVMTIVYILIVLRSIRGEAPDHQVPHLSVTVGTGLGLTCVLVLLVFIQGIAKAMVADEVVKRAERELGGAIESLPPLDPANPPEDADGIPGDFAERAERLALRCDGYVQAIDYDSITYWAERNDAVALLDVRPGDFVVKGDGRILVRGPGDVRERGAELLDSITIGDDRTPTQDIEFAIRHLVEVAVRALSPGINDPFTAISVIDRIRASLTRVMERQLPSETIRSASGRTLVYRSATTYDGILDAALHQIRQAGSTHPAVMIHLLEAIGQIAEHARLEEQRQALARHAGLVWSAVQRDADEPADCDDAGRSFRRAMQRLRSEVPARPTE